MMIRPLNILAMGFLSCSADAPPAPRYDYQLKIQDPKTLALYFALRLQGVSLADLNGGELKDPASTAPPKAQDSFIEQSEAENYLLLHGDQFPKLQALYYGQAPSWSLEKSQLEKFKRPLAKIHHLIGQQSHPLDAKKN